ncbi:MAG: hypothetical protein WCH32_04705 [Pseudomonadota bacterium]|nr:hypothetical protein [Pseudomonadota bacterium]
MSDIKSPRISPALASGDVVRTGSTGMTGRFERPVLPRVPSRHGAITRTLNNYASYKRWAEKMMTNWEPGKDPKV